jgi:tetratricopeptide (TPR) repeat protein
LLMFRSRSIGLLLALTTLLVYLPATTYQFINYDDPDYVSDNPVIQNGLTWAGVKWAFTGAHSSNWHPLTWLSHMVDCDLFLLNPAGPHLMNILFHAMNAALLFTLLFRLTKKLWACAFIAALFAWHPLHVESVAWIAERKDVLSTFFSLLSLICYARFVQENHRRSFWFSLFFFLLALLSKPMPVTLPLVMLLLDYWPLMRMEHCPSARANSAAVEPENLRFYLTIVFKKWPFLLMAAVLCVITISAQRNAVSSLINVPLSLRLQNALTAYSVYLWKMVWPLHLAIFYPLRAPIAWPPVAESAIVLTGISILAWHRRKHSPWLFVGWFWFLITLVPVIGLVQVGAQAMADRYSYFPSIGIFLALSFSVQAMVERFNFLKTWMTGACIFILGAGLILTEKQLSYWHDSASLFSHAITVEDSATARLSLGLALQDQNKISEAMTQFLMTLQLNPESVLAYDDIAKLLDDEGKTEAAAFYCREAVRRKPRSAPAHVNLGIILSKRKLFEEAINEFSIAANLDPNYADPHFLTAQLLLQHGRDAEALIQLHKALNLDPDDGQILVFTASVLASDTNSTIRDGSQARLLAEKAVKLTKGRQAAALDALAMADAETGQFEEAVQIQEQAVKLMETLGSKDDLSIIQKRLQLYRTRQPWRESFKKNGP